jgi:hypothetical protein
MLLVAVANAQERTYTWTLTPNEVRYIGSLLDEQKVKDAGALMTKLQSQILQQDQAAQASAQQNYDRMVRERIEKDAASKAAEEQKP